MILRDPKTRKMKIKLYTEPSGQLKGDGLVNYIRVESVQLAIDMLDGYEIKGHKIKVQRAQFQMHGEYNPKLKPKRNKHEKEKLKKLKDKLLAWHPDKMRGERGKHERVVIIKNLFEPSIFDNQVDLIIDYQNNVRGKFLKQTNAFLLNLFLFKTYSIAVEPKQITFFVEKRRCCVKYIYLLFISICFHFSSLFFQIR